MIKAFSLAHRTWHIAGRQGDAAAAEHVASQGGGDDIAGALHQEVHRPQRRVLLHGVQHILPRRGGRRK